MKQFSWSYFAIKMTSRKLWLSVAGLATAIMALMNVESNTQVKIVALISAVSVVVGYLIANGLTDDTDTTTETDTDAVATASSEDVTETDSETQSV